MDKRKIISRIIESAREFGLYYIDVKNAEELLVNYEFGLALDTVITQLYEHEIAVDMDFYKLVVRALQIIGLQEEEYSFIKELIKI